MHPFTRCADTLLCQLTSLACRRLSHVQAGTSRPSHVSAVNHVPHRRVTAGAAIRDDLLKGVSRELREDVARIIEQAERAAGNWTTGFTNFHSPPVCNEALSAISQMADVAAVRFGGYEMAERCRLAVGREELLAAAADDPGSLGCVAALAVQGNFMFDPATHPDFLGACLGTGVDRSKVGDIILQGEQGAQILVVPNLVPFLETSLIQVRSVPVTAREIPLSELRVRAPKVEPIHSTEASLRLDAIASAGFRMSRSKMSDMIKSGDVRVNWKTGAKASADVQAGDVISCTGKGRIEVQTVTLTKKGKYSVEMIRYV